MKFITILFYVESTIQIVLADIQKKNRTKR